MIFVLADDHALVREALVPFIQKADPSATVLQASTYDHAITVGKEAGEALKLFVLDFKMPGMNGLSGLKGMRKQFPQAQVVVLSGMANRSEALALLKGGADGFIPKSLGGDAMVNALRLVLSGGQYFPSTFFQDLPEASDGSGFAGVGAALTRQERDVLELLVEGLSNKEIAQRLNFQEVTIKKRLSAAYRKLGVSSRLQAVQVLNAARQG